MYKQQHVALKYKILNRTRPSELEIQRNTNYKGYITSVGYNGT